MVSHMKERKQAMTAFKVRVLIEKVIEINDAELDEGTIEDTLRDWFKETPIYNDDIAIFVFEKGNKP